MPENSQVKSQDDYPVTIRKLMRLGSAYAVTLPPQWVRSLDPGDPHYLRVQLTRDGSVLVSDIPASALDRPIPPDPSFGY